GTRVAAGVQPVQPDLGGDPDRLGERVEQRRHDDGQGGGRDDHEPHRGAAALTGRQHDDVDEDAEDDRPGRQPRVDRDRTEEVALLRAALEVETAAGAAFPHLPPAGEEMARPAARAVLEHGPPEQGRDAGALASDDVGGIQLTHCPRSSSTFFRTLARSVMIPPAPRSSSRWISAGSSIVHTWPGIARRAAACTNLASTSVRPFQVSGTCTQAAANGPTGTP